MPIIVRLLGGLGSQMSQYAYAKSLESRGFDVLLDASEYLFYRKHGLDIDKYNINLPFTDGIKKLQCASYNMPIFKWSSKLFGSAIFDSKDLIFTKISGLAVHTEESHLFDKRYIEIGDNSYVIGDFKSEKYFSTQRSSLKKDFTFKFKESEYFKCASELISAAPFSCFIHVRRGDFVSEKRVSRVHGSCDPDYYHRAAKYIMDRVPNVKFFLFSNDLAWCYQNIKIQNCTYMFNDSRLYPHEDIELMSRCDHSIIDHSAFCWWGAWLNEGSSQIVVAPKRWFADDVLNAQASDIWCAAWVRV